MDVPERMRPEVLDCADDFGSTAPELFGSAIPICGVAGDQQAAVIGQACFAPGMIMATYGTGCFALINTGKEFVASQNRLLTTIAYRLKGETHYALEGPIFIAGAAVQWLRAGIKIIDNAEQSGTLAAQADDHQDVYLVPAFVGLGAPWWDPDARGAIFSVTRGTGPAEFVRAALESVCFQPYDLLKACTRISNPARAKPSCGSMAVWLLRTGPCSGLPTFSMRRLIGQPTSKRQRWVRPSWQARMLASGPT